MPAVHRDPDRLVIRYYGLSHAVAVITMPGVGWLTCCGLSFANDLTEKGTITCLMCLSNLSLSVDTTDSTT